VSSSPRPEKAVTGATRLAGMRPPGPRPMGERASGGTPRPGALRAPTLKERVGAGSGLASLSTPPALAVEWRAGADHGVATPDSQTKPTVEEGAHRWWKEEGYLRGRGAPAMGAAAARRREGEEVRIDD
jgi:hypothetical protein